jgi:hypothetical protein
MFYDDKKSAGVDEASDSSYQAVTVTVPRQRSSSRRCARWHQV